MIPLIPALAITGITGLKLAGRSMARPVRIKKRRMAGAAVNGVLVLTPCALVLSWLANDGTFGVWFYLTQAVELIAGPINVAPIALNIRDGLRLSGRLKKPTDGTLYGHMKASTSARNRAA